MNRKTGYCPTCGRHFWYMDPRPGGRPRKKCGYCATRPPRHEWDYYVPDEEDDVAPFDEEETELELEPEEELEEEPEELEEEPEPEEEAPELPFRERLPDAEWPSRRREQLIPFGGRSRTSLEPRRSSRGTVQVQSAAALEPDEVNQIHLLQERIDRLEKQTEELEQKLSAKGGFFVSRSDWIDLSARLDIVEQQTSGILGKVRGRLDTFTKEVRQIAVIPERELHEITEMVRLIRRYLSPDAGNRRG